MEKLTQDPRLPEVKDDKMRPLTRRLYELFRGYVSSINELVDYANIASPVGMVSDFALSSAPQGWLRCNGTAVSRSTYHLLFSAIGTTFGSGNGSTTFNIPNVSSLNASMIVCIKYK